MINYFLDGNNSLKIFPMFLHLVYPVGCWDQLCWTSRVSSWAGPPGFPPPEVVLEVELGPKHSHLAKYFEIFSELK